MQTQALMSSGLSWEVVAILTTIVLAWSGLLVGVIKWLLNTYQRNLEKAIELGADDAKTRHDRLTDTLQKQAGELHRLDKEILGLRAELPDKFVRREDAIREQVVINAKLDALAAKIDVLATRGNYAN